MSSEGKVTVDHLRRAAYLYVRQSSIQQVRDHRESTARQYDLQRRAQTLGWPSERIVVIDEDLGLSGAAAVERSGFQRLVAEVGLGRVGLVMGLEVSRLARNSTDWHRLLEICALAETLFLDEDGLYDPSHFNDRLLLGLKGTMSEAELHVLRARLLGGQLNKARRGELWMLPPIGFIYDARQHLILDPDEQVQHSVRALFEAFRRTGSACQVVRHFSREGLRFPRRLRGGARSGEVLFVPLAHHRVLHVLHNPRYAGAFVYGRTRQRKIVIAGQNRYRRLPREEWKIFLPNAHPGYISWEEFETNQVMLKTNAAGYGYDRRRSPPREGTALLQGMVLCGRCGTRMTVRYTLRKGHPVADYVCQRRGIEQAQPLCQSVPGTGLDDAISAVVLEAVTPASLEIALEVFEELRARSAEIDRLRRARVQRAREEAELAQRQFLLVRPEHRLVADELERQWNEKLAEIAAAEEEYRRTCERDGDGLTDDAKAQITALAADLPRLWKDPRTPARERKRMLRLLVEDVTLTRAQTIGIHIRWKGGATTSLERALPLRAPDLRRTPAAIVEQIRILATEKTDAEIARSLNARALRTGTGQPFTRLLVRHVRKAYDIASCYERLRADGWRTVSEMARELRLHASTTKRFAQEGLLHAVRASDRGDILLAPLTEPPPMPQPGKRLRDRRRHEKLVPHVRKELQCEA